jgi:hypothetical protein
MDRAGGEDQYEGSLIVDISETAEARAQAADACVVEHANGR